MPEIRPSSDLWKNYNEISAYCHENGEPVYITKNGKGDLAVLSIETYERLVGKFELYSLLAEGTEDIRAERTSPAGEVLSKIREDLTNGTL